MGVLSPYAVIDVEEVGLGAGLGEAYVCYPKLTEVACDDGHEVLEPEPVDVDVLQLHVLAQALDEVDEDGVAAATNLNDSDVTIDDDDEDEDSLSTLIEDVNGDNIADVAVAAAMGGVYALSGMNGSVIWHVPSMGINY